MTPTWSAGRFQLQLERPLVMAIVNVTPDSFSDGGQHASSAAALAHAEQMLREGADILDIGGESTRPGATPLDAAAEWARVGPVLRELVGWRVPLSLDTYHPQTMAAGLELGVDIINDIRALREPGAEDAVLGSDCGVCLMHMQGDPASMQRDPDYADVVAEVGNFLQDRADALRARGMDAARICIDPGFGFGKTLAHNLELGQHLDALVRIGYPLLVGVSRKSMLGAALQRPLQQRLPASLAAALACVAAGAAVVRVHDVEATCDALTVWRALRGERRGQRA